MPSDSSFSAYASLVTLTGLCTRTLAPMEVAARAGMKPRKGAPRSRATTMGPSRRAFIRGDLLADRESQVWMLFGASSNEQYKRSPPVTGWRARLRAPKELPAKLTEPGQALDPSCRFPKDGYRRRVRSPAAPREPVHADGDGLRARRSRRARGQCAVRRRADPPRLLLARREVPGIRRVRPVRGRREAGARGRR